MARQAERVQFGKDPCSSNNPMATIIQERDHGLSRSSPHHGENHPESRQQLLESIKSMTPDGIGSPGSKAAGGVSLPASDHHNPQEHHHPASPRAAMPSPSNRSQNIEEVTVAIEEHPMATPAVRPHPTAVPVSGYRGVTTVLPSYIAGLGNKRYRECMDYAHLGCRHFVPCDDGDDDGQGEKMAMGKTMVTVPSLNQRVMAFKVPRRQGEGIKHGAGGEEVTARWMSLERRKRFSEEKSFGVSSSRGDPSKVTKGDEGVVETGGALEDPSRAALEMGIHPGRKKVVDVCSSSGDMAAAAAAAAVASSQVTACGVASVERGNRLHRHSTRKNTKKKVKEEEEEEEGEKISHSHSHSLLGDAMAARSRDDRVEELENLGDEMDDPGSGDRMSEAALDVLAEAAIQASSSPAEDCSEEMVDVSGEEDDGQEVDELGRRIWRKARFVHGEIQFVQKRVVRRYSRPRSKAAMELGSGAGSGKRQQEQQPPPPQRSSQRRIAQQPRKLLADDFEYGDPRKERSRNDDQDHRQGAKRKTMSSTTAAAAAELGNSRKKVTTKKMKTGGGSLPKKRNLSTVVRKSEATNKVPTPTSTIVDHRHLQFMGDGVHDEHRLESAAPVPVMVVEETVEGGGRDQDDQNQSLGAVVRSKRGRSQNLPLRFQGSVIGTWKKGEKKKTSKSS